MSDTTITITPEERRLLRSGGYGDYERLRLLNALEAAEARAEQAEAQVARLTKAVKKLSDWCSMLESGYTLAEIGLSLSNGMACPEPWQYEEAARKAVAGEGKA